MSNLNKALQLAKAGQTLAAKRIYAGLLKANPKNAEVLAAVILFQNRYDGHARPVLPMVQALLQLRPKSDRSHRLAAETLGNCDQTLPALEHAKRALKIGPNNSENAFIAAVAMMGAGRFLDAKTLLDDVLSKDPENKHCLIQLARVHQAQGDAGKAAEVAQRILKSDSESTDALWIYAASASLDADDPIISHLETKLVPQAQKLGGRLYKDLLEVLSVAKMRSGQTDAAFECATMAKEHSKFRHNAPAAKAFVDGVTSDLKASDFPPNSGQASKQPVMIVGMPRIGSTLLERMLMAHPKVSSVGEGSSLRLIARDIGVDRYSHGPMVRAIKEMPQEGAAQLAQRYLDETAQITAPNDVVLDKALHNFELLGLQARLFPKAPILHMLRDPLDTCVSCYLQRLSGWHSYTQTLDDLGQAYLDHLRFMDHWAKTLPNPILAVGYEALLADPETTLRAAVDHLGLDWDPACLDHTNSNKDQPVLTLSSGQVSKPLYNTSVKRWQALDAHLGPLKDKLAPLYPDGFDAPAVYVSP